MGFFNRKLNEKEIAIITREIDNQVKKSPDEVLNIIRDKVNQEIENRKQQRRAEETNASNIN